MTSSAPNIGPGDFYAEELAQPEPPVLHGLTPNQKAAYEAVMAYLIANPRRTEAEALSRLKIDERLYFRAKRKAESCPGEAFGERGYHPSDLIRFGDPIVGGGKKQGVAERNARAEFEAGEVGAKRCKTCGGEFPITQFGKHKMYPDGRRPHCRDCNNARHRELARARRVREKAKREAEDAE